MKSQNTKFKVSVEKFLPLKYVYHASKILTMFKINNNQYFVLPYSSNKKNYNNNNNLVCDEWDLSLCFEQATATHLLH